MIFREIIVWRCKILVIIRWHGHACFEIIPKIGISIVIDPHDGASIGIEPPKAKADIVLITHDHFDHNAYRVVSKPTTQIIMSRKGEFSIGPQNAIKVKGISAYHDTYRGRRRGSIVMYKLIVDELSILHMGDLGHVLGREQVNEISHVDVALIPVGGTFTIGPEEAWRTLDILRPKVAIPMHYWISGINLPLLSVEEFIGRASEGWDVKHIASNEVSLTKETLPERSTVFVLKPP